MPAGRLYVPGAQDGMPHIVLGLILGVVQSLLPTLRADGCDGGEAEGNGSETFDVARWDAALTEAIDGKNQPEHAKALRDTIELIKETEAYKDAVPYFEKEPCLFTWAMRMKLFGLVGDQEFSLDVNEDEDSYWHFKMPESLVFQFLVFARLRRDVKIAGCLISNYLKQVHEGMKRMMRMAGRSGEWSDEQEMFAAMKEVDADFTAVLIKSYYFSNEDWSGLFVDNLELEATSMSILNAIFLPFDRTMPKTGGLRSVDTEKIVVILSAAFRKSNVELFLCMLKLVDYWIGRSAPEERVKGFKCVFEQVKSWWGLRGGHKVGTEEQERMYDELRMWVFGYDKDGDGVGEVEKLLCVV
jgi:hypothetical protein